MSVYTKGEVCPFMDTKTLAELRFPPLTLSPLTSQKENYQPKKNSYYCPNGALL